MEVENAPEKGGRSTAMKTESQRVSQTSSNHNYSCCFLLVFFLYFFDSLGLVWSLILACSLFRTALCLVFLTFIVLAAATPGSIIAILF